ncbi:cyclic nucleotide-gated ion channel 1-like isoform X1 [Pyrus x bretschneideri]|uniref:cyclic nucleotide-gated ion channel 1-like isoform X1 n=2 Tax=Pyrus x bretschneideri TaxID=225117 RepID=UPI0020302708|nr:cyclic nucleotide-gated ion channel 1-like isoform X1 [Pyrus x bretschneideri]
MNPSEEERTGIPSPILNPAATTGESCANIDYGRNRPTKKLPLLFCEIFGPNAEFLQVRNSVIVLVWAFAVLVDPLFLYTPVVNKDMMCVTVDKKLAAVAFTFRLLADMCYLSAIIGGLVPVHKVGTPEVGIAVGRRGSAKETLGRCNLISILAISPIPYVVILFYAEIIRGSRSTRMFLNFLLVLHYMTQVVRFNDFRKILEKNITKHTPKIWIDGVFNFWIRTSFTFFTCILASQVFGAFWYFFSLQREIDCWQYACRSENACELEGFNCRDKDTFRNVTLLNNLCRPATANPPAATFFDFGIFLDAIRSGILSSTDFPQKFLHCFWWGLRNISSFGQNLQTSNYIWENLFAVFVSVTGLLLVLIYLNAILQMYVQLTAALSKENRKLREMKKRSPQIASWFDENDLPLDWKEKIMTCALHKLNADEDIDIINIHNILPRKDLMDIKRHLCLNTLNKVSMLQNVSEKEFEVFCKYLKPVIYKADTFIVREGEPFYKMLFITQGTVRTYTTTSDDGRGSSSTGNTVGDECFQKGDFYGEELLQDWVSIRRFFSYSTKNVRCITKVEGFTLTIKDIERSRNIADKAKYKQKIEPLESEEA